MKSWNGLNILDYIDWLMDQGITEENAENIASIEFDQTFSDDFRQDESEWLV